MFYKVIIKRVQISEYYAEAECAEQAQLKAEAYAANDDWSKDYATYTPIETISNGEPF